MFLHDFLDKFLIDENNYLKDLRTYGTGLSQDKIALLLGLNKATIRRYESSSWNKCKVPAWYPIILRFLSGDLSYFGTFWHNCRIHPADKKMSLKNFPHTRFKPSDLTMQYNTIANMAKKELRLMQADLDRLADQNKLLKMKNAELELNIEKLNSINERLNAHNAGINSGKVVSLFGS